MVTVDLLLFWFVSVPLKLIVPVLEIVPALITWVLTVTWNWLVFTPMPNTEMLQVTVAPRVPAAGAVQVPNPAGERLTESNFRLLGMVLEKTTALAVVLVLFFTFQVKASGAPPTTPVTVGPSRSAAPLLTPHHFRLSRAVTVGPPLEALPLSCRSVVEVGGAGVRVKLLLGLITFPPASVPPKVEFSVAGLP